MKKSIVKDIKRFLFEFIIVTLGILTAFGINKWDENKKLGIEERKVYQSLKKDLERELYVFSFYKKPLVNANAYITPILENNYTNVDTLEHYLQVGFDLQEGNATYSNLKFSGKLEILKNNAIKSRLILYYETYYQGLEKMSKMNHEFLFYSLKPYLIKNLKYRYGREDLLNLLKEDEFLNLMKSQKGLLMYSISTIEKSEKLVNQILDELKKELGEELAIK